VLRFKTITESGFLGQERQSTVTGNNQGSFHNIIRSSYPHPLYDPVTNYQTFHPATGKKRGTRLRRLLRIPTIKKRAEKSEAG
jgi:hypothetical protein